MSKHGLISNFLEDRIHVYFPHFSAGLVPTDPQANKAWRQRYFFTNSEKDKAEIRQMCKEDFLFWLTGFVSLFDAGDYTGEPGPQPFIPYDFQIELFTRLWRSLHETRQQVRILKPRRMGVSWGMMALFAHCWQFKANCHLLVGSHREEEVDAPMATTKSGLFVGEWSKLLPKIDFIHVHQPPWLLPEGYKPRTEPYAMRMRRVNPENGSIIWGTSASAQAAHGERGYAALWDEAALTENLYEIISGLSKFSAVKFWVSTRGNMDHAFSNVLKEAPGIDQIRLDIFSHPLFAEGMTVDSSTGKKSSPLLEKELAEINYDTELSNRIYFADETVQIGSYYKGAVMSVMLGTSDKPGTCMDPILVGEMDIISTELGPRVRRFCPQPNGRWKLWFNLDAAGRPPHDERYVAGIDTSAGVQESEGTGRSNSVIAVAGWKTGEIMAEFSTCTMQPYELAEMLVAVAYWFEGNDYRPMCCVPESNGIGQQLIASLRKLKFLEMYVVDPKKPDQYGWHKDGRAEGGALEAFGLHAHMIVEGTLIERSFECAKEMRHYQHNPSGRGAPIHPGAYSSDDPATARDNHGDRVITRICLCQVLKNPMPVEITRGQAPWGSYRYASENEKREEENSGVYAEYV